MRIGLFITCLGDTLFPETGRATVTVLERLGHTVVFPAGQTCCGQMHANSGHGAEAMPLLRRFVEGFADTELDAIVAPSGSCVAMVRHHYPRLAAEAGDPMLEAAVEALRPRVFELCELLIDELEVEDVGASYPHRVAYHPSCHGLRMLRLGDAPLRLLRRVRGIELIEIDEAEACCGFGGTFAVKNVDVSAAMLADKVGSVLGTGAEVCTATDSSCLMHIGGALRRQRSGVRAVHIAEILAAEEAGMSPSGGFPEAAREAVADSQLRANLRNATHTIRDKRAAAVAEVPDWEELREAGRRIKAQAVRHLDLHLEALEESVGRAGGTVHWAADAEAANRIVGDLVAATGEREVVKVKSMVTDEIRLNEALAARGIDAIETDLAELINQLAGDTSSHILVPAIHRNRAEIRDLFLRTLPDTDGLDETPRALAEAARRHLRQKFLTAEVAISGANFAVAETGTVCVVESEGNGRMCTTLPRTLITVMGIEKVVPRLADLEVMLQLLPRSATAERMNPYTSLWTGVTPGDGPREFHLVLLDGGRTNALRDEVGRQALHCIRCSACLNVCPVYERTGGHAYGSVYPGPIGAILTPQLSDLERGATLPWASSLCGACYDVCPVKIDIPTVLVHLRDKVVARGGTEAEDRAEALSMKAAAHALGTTPRYRRAQRIAIGALRLLARVPVLGRLAPGPLAAWTSVRELPEPPGETFSDWWRGRHR